MNKLLKKIILKKINLPTARNSTKTCLFWRGSMFNLSRFKEELGIAIWLANKRIKIDFIVCGKLLKKCSHHQINFCKSSICNKCYKNSKAYFNRLRANYYFMGSFVNEKMINNTRLLSKTITLEDISGYEIDGIHMGIITNSSFNRFGKSSITANELINSKKNSNLENIYREIFFSSLICLYAAKEVFKQKKFDYVFMQHGCYSLWGPAYQYFAKQGVSVITWGGAHKIRARCFRISVGNDLASPSVPDRSHWESIKDKPLSKKEHQQLSNYMLDRINQIDKVKKFNYKRIKRILNKDKKPLWLIPAHINWDWDGRINHNDINDIFTDSTEWFIETLKAIRDIDDITWIIKPYPLESKEMSLRTTLDLYRKALGNKSYSHIIIIDKKVNSYKLFPFINGCVVLHGSLGIEASLFGLPTIGTAPWSYYAKVANHPLVTQEKYFEDLKNAKNIPYLSKSQIQVAERFAYDLFIYRQVYNFGKCAKVEALCKVRKSKIIKRICNDILKNKTIGGYNQPLGVDKDWKKTIRC